MPKEKTAQIDEKIIVRPSDFGELYNRVREILESARKRVARSVNSEMVQAYWLVGQAIVEQEQQGQSRADYGEKLIVSLAEKMKVEGFKGFQSRNLWRMRDFYLKFPKVNAVRSQLSWTHYRLLLKVFSDAGRSYYELEAAAENWSTRELERQINSRFYERAIAFKEKPQIENKGKKKAAKYQPQDFIKDPFVLEFLNLKDIPDLTESKLEQALLDHLQEFLLELGKGFSFVARQKRITIDGDHFYIDLVLYNRLLRCFVLIELKLGALTHQDIGQMMLYTNYYTREMLEEWENPTIGILLCAEKNDAVVRYTLPENEKQIFASRYQDFLPTEAELVEEIERERAKLLQLKGLEKE